jgi:hypothetical protein
MVTGHEVALNVLSAIALGAVVGSAGLLLAGRPSLRPDRRQLTDALGRSGLEVASLERAGVDARGSTPYFAKLADGRRLFVKALGQDERDADLLFRSWRRLRLQNVGDELPYSTLRRAVEHEALVSLKASDAGVRTPTWSPWPRSASWPWCWPTRPSTATRSTRSTPASSTTRCCRGCGGRWRGCGGSGSPTGTCAWPTCSSTPTATPG